MNINLTLKIPLSSENGHSLYKLSSSEPLSLRNSVDMPGIKAFQDKQVIPKDTLFERECILKAWKITPSYTFTQILTVFLGLQSWVKPWHNKVVLALGKLILPYSKNLNYKAGHKKVTISRVTFKEQTNKSLLPHCLDSHQPVSYWVPRRMCLKMSSFLHWRKTPFRVIKPRAFYSTTTLTVPGLRMPPFLFGE